MLIKLLKTINLALNMFIHHHGDILTEWTLYVVVVPNILLTHHLIYVFADTYQGQDADFTDTSHHRSGCLSTCCCCCIYHTSAVGRGGTLCCDHLLHRTTSNNNDNTKYLIASVGMIILLLISLACIGIGLFVCICKGDQGQTRAGPLALTLEDWLVAAVWRRV